MGLEPASFTDPPFEPACLVCDGIRKVEVAKISDRDGRLRDWPTSPGSEHDPPAPEVDCPWCAR